jgi:hypothetical protein
MLRSLRHRSSVFLQLLRIKTAEHVERHSVPAIAKSIDAATQWLCHAQDGSASHDGGVARHYSMWHGWSASYPETTGYIIPTLLDRADELGDALLRERARRMLDWLVSIQFPDGGIQGGVVGETPRVPVTFNTGQVLFSLARGTEVFGEAYRPAMRAAADWLVATQDPDGAWRRHATPFAQLGDKTYETHVAWGLLEAARLDPDQPYGDAALRNMRWALTKQRPNGWLADCCLNNPARPLTHTLGYALRGIVEAYRFSGDQQFLDAALRTSYGLIPALRSDGYLAGRLDARWHDAANWVCLTGNVQLAHCWLMLYQYTGDVRLRNAGFAANRFVRNAMVLHGPPEICGAVAGSWPLWGDYGRFRYLNWACKFFIDSHRLELSIRDSM